MNLCGNSSMASKMACLLASGNVVLFIMLPKLMYITPNLASSTNDLRSYRNNLVLFTGVLNRIKILFIKFIN